jgi:predicted transposase/invertase (TIGR01784 family)
MIIDIDPCVDIVFKKLFGSPEHPALTKSFVNAMLEAAGLPIAVDLTIQNPFRLAEFEGEKSSELDILYKDASGRNIQLEMQVAAHAGLSQRMIHNWAQLYYRQIGKSQDYYSHRPVISIWILDKAMFRDGHWLHLFRFNCPKNGRILHEDASIVTVELPVWMKLNRRSEHGILKVVEKWTYFLTHADGAEGNDIVSALGDPVFEEAVEIMVEITRSEKMRHAYDMRKNYQHIIASYKRTGYEEGKAEGMADGKAEGIAQGLAEGKAEGKAEALRETARTMKARGMSIEDIAAITGLSVGEIVLV